MDEFAKFMDFPIRDSRYRPPKVGNVADIPSAVPSFFLYGEPPRPVDDRFLHVEDLDDRSRPSDWTIRPHRHANLHHVFHMTGGQGVVQIDETFVPFVAPQLLIIPAMLIHGFRYHPEAKGQVLTLSESYLSALLARGPELEPLMSDFACVPPGDGTSFALDLGRLGAELSWRALGHEGAVEGRLLAILVDVLRSVRPSLSSGSALGPEAILVARFRRIVERRFRETLAMDDYARSLDVTVSRLRKACRTTLTSPQRIVQSRIVLEAKRLLLYSAMTVAEVSYSVGFSDPAYFSRVFSKWVGEAPSSFRASYKSNAPAPSAKSS